MSRLVRLVSTAVLSASVVFLPADVYASHFPSEREHATTIVHGLRVAGEPKQLERSVDKRGHNQKYVDELLKQLKARVGEKYNIKCEDGGPSWNYTFEKK